MAFKNSSTYGTNPYPTFTSDGIPYIWTPNGANTSAPTLLITKTDPNNTNADNFGYSVAVGSSRIVVGAKNVLTSGAQGAIYIYDLSGTLLVTKTDPNLNSSDLFGYSVAAGCGKIVAGAPGVGAAYVYDHLGNFAKQLGAGIGNFGISVAVGSGRIVAGNSQSGAAGGYLNVYDLNGNSVIAIANPNNTRGDNFGVSSAVGSNRIVVGAPNYNSNTGRVYIYDLNGTLLKTITGQSASQFGASVAAGSGRIVVGAQAGGVGGYVYIYDINGNLLKSVPDPNNVAFDYFGGSVSVGSGRIVVGSYGYTSSSYRGAAYIYDLDGNLITTYIDPNNISNDVFGQSVSVGSGRVIVGSNYQNTNGFNVGAAYIYSTPSIYTPYDAVEITQFGQ